MQHDKLSWGIFAAIRRDASVLIKKRSDGTWDLPGGGQEPGEQSPFVTLAREVREEVGMDLASIKGMIGSYLPFHIEAKGKTDIACIYGCEADGEPSVSNEATSFKWIDLPEAMEWIRNGHATLGPIVGPKDRVGRTARMILDATTVLWTVDHSTVNNNLDVPYAEGWQLSKDGLWLVQRPHATMLYAWRRRDPFEPDGLMKAV